MHTYTDTQRDTRIRVPVKKGGIRTLRNTMDTRRRAIHEYTDAYTRGHLHRDTHIHTVRHTPIDIIIYRDKMIDCESFK